MMMLDMDTVRFFTWNCDYEDALYIRSRMVAFILEQLATPVETVC